MDKMYLVFVKNSKKQILDRYSLSSLIDNDFLLIESIQPLQGSKMSKFKVKLLKNDKPIFVESAQMNKIIDEHFLLIESINVVNEAYNDEMMFYPEVINAAGKLVWTGHATYELDDAIEEASDKAEELAKKKNKEYFGRVIDEDDLIAYTESEDEGVADKYQEEDDIEDDGIEDLEFDDAETADLEAGEDEDDRMMKTLQASYEQKKARYDNILNALGEIKRKIKRGELSAAQMANTIEYRKIELEKAKNEVLKTQNNIEKYVKELKDKKADREKKHEDLWNNQQLDVNKRTRMDANITASDDEFDALSKELGL